MYLYIHIDARMSCATVAATIKKRGIISRTSRDTYFSGRDRSLLSLQNNQELSLLGRDLVNGWLTFCVFSLLVQMSFPFLLCSSHTYSQSRSLSTVYPLPRFSLVFPNPPCFSVLKNKEVTLATAMGKMHLAPAVKWLWSSSKLPSGQSCYTYLCCSHSWLCHRLPREKPGRQTAWKELAAACSSPQPQDSHKVFLQWECVFGSFLPGCSFSLLAWHHLPHNRFPQPFTGRAVCLDLQPGSLPSSGLGTVDRVTVLLQKYPCVKQGMGDAARSRRRLLKCYKHLEYDQLLIPPSGYMGCGPSIQPYNAKWFLADSIILVAN